MIPRLVRILIFLFSSVGLALSAGAAMAVTGSITVSQQFESNGFLVKTRPTVDERQRLQLFASNRLTEVHRFTLVPGLSYVRQPPGQVTAATVQTLQANPDIEYIEPNYIVRIQQRLPNDPQFSSLYGLDNRSQSGGRADADIDAPEAWALQTGSDVIVAVIDSGVDYTHVDLRDNIWTNPGEIAANGIDDDGNGYVDDLHGWDFYNNDNDPMDDNFHGTHVAGTIAARGNNGIGVVGVNWSAKIMALKFIGPNGGGGVNAAIAALEYAVANGARISNNSWGGGGRSQALREAIAAAGRQGHLFVTAAGNDGINTDISPVYPASYDLDNIIAVAATDQNDRLAKFSNFGSSSVDLAAPGVEILSTVPNDQYRVVSGTSMAAPHVAGAAALLLAQNRGLTITGLKAALLNGTDPLAAPADATVSGGRLNVFRALTQLSGGTAITITPSRLTIAAGAQQAFTASGGSSPYRWATTNTAVGRIDATGGLFSALAEGTTRVVVTDALGNQATTGDLVVTQTRITPATATITVGQTRRFVATGGTPPYTFSVSDDTLARIDTTGVLRADSVGSVTVTVSDANNISATTGPVTLVGQTLTIRPDTLILGLGDQQRFSVSGGNTPYTWTVDNPAIAAIDNTGLLTARAVGSARVEVTDNTGSRGVSGPITVRRITVTPSTATLNVGDTTAFNASGGRAPYLWSTSDPQTASIDDTGILTALAGGTVVVTATDADGIQGTSDRISITGAEQLRIQRLTTPIQVGAEMQMTATGGVPPYRWISADSSIITVDELTGVATAVAVGSTFVNVTDTTGASASSELLQVRQLLLTPAQRTLKVGETLQFSAQGGTAPITWESSDAQLATIDSTGLLKALAAGTVVVTATDSQGLRTSSGTITIAATDPGLTIQPDSASLDIGESLTFEVTAGQGRPPYTWTSTNPDVATIDATTGTLTAIAAGITRVRATDTAGQTGETRSITITGATVEPLQISPSTARMSIGEQIQLNVTGGTPPYNWRSLNSAVVETDAEGTLTGIAPGTTALVVRDASGLSTASGIIFVSAAPRGTFAPGEMTPPPPSDRRPQPAAASLSTNLLLILLTLFHLRRPL